MAVWLDENTKYEKQEERPNTTKFSRTGHTGLKRWGGTIKDEFLDELRGEKGIEAYKEMSRNDPVVGAVLYAIRHLIKGVDWRIETGGNSPEDEMAAKFVRDALWDDKEYSWDDTLEEIMSFLQYGWHCSEVVYERNDNGTITWEGWYPRGQATLDQWDFDDHGHVQGLYQSTNYTDQTYLPMDKLLHFRTQSRRDNPEGLSLLRTSWRSYYYKKNLQEVEAIAIERSGAGMPKLQPPEELNIWNSDNPEMVSLKNAAEDLVTNVRMDEQMGIVIPGGWDFELVSGAANMPDTDPIIRRYNQEIAVATLGDFLLLGAEDTGSYAMSVSKQRLFQKALDSIVESIAETINRQGIKKLIDLNDFDVEKYPKLVPSKVESPPIDDLGAYINNIASAGAPLFPDDSLENYLLDRADLPTENQE